MVIILKADDTVSSISMGLYCCATVILQMSKDGKGFIVHKHRYLKIEKEAYYPMSYLTNIVKAGM
jgi:hypothetical protein